MVNTINISIVTKKGVIKPVPAIVTPKTSIRKLRDTYEARFPTLPSGSVVLSFDGRDLDMKSTLESNNVPDGATLRANWTCMLPDCICPADADDCTCPAGDDI